MAIYKLPLDDELDKDIIDWIASFPRNRKSEIVRQVLKAHINGTTLTQAVTPIQEPVVEETKESDKTEESTSSQKPNRYSKVKDNMGVVSTKKPVDMSGILS